jgi:hypothetical protein
VVILFRLERPGKPAYRKLMEGGWTPACRKTLVLSMFSL